MPFPQLHSPAITGRPAARDALQDAHKILSFNFTSSTSITQVKQPSHCCIHFLISTSTMKASALSPLFIAQLAADVDSFGINSSLFTRNTQLRATNDESDKKRVVVIGNGMVGQRFMENLIDLDTDKKCVISTFCEEPRAAYNRVKLTSYFETRDPSALSMTSEFDNNGRTPWYEENNVELLLNDKVVSVDTKSKTVTGASGKTVDYDVPPIPGKQRPGVFVYRVSFTCQVLDLGQ
jgi:hypothetical protein